MREVYNYIRKENPQRGKGKGSSSGSPSDDGEQGDGNDESQNSSPSQGGKQDNKIKANGKEYDMGGDGFDEHDWENFKDMTPEEIKEISEGIDKALREGGMLAGRMGAKMPRAISDLLEPKIDWKEVLREFVSSTMKTNLDLSEVNDLYDSYNSIYHSLYHSAAYLNKPITIISKKVDGFDLNTLKDYDGVIIPGGFGYNNTDLLIKALELCRLQNIPTLGICLGMQLMVIEGLNNLCKISSTSQEFIKENASLQIDNIKPCIHLIEDDKKAMYGYKIQGDMGGNMRLGSYECHLKPGSLAFKVYGTEVIHERHRHRYEVNNEFVHDLEEMGYIFSGKNIDGNLMEIIEYSGCKFFIGCQFHPELKSKINIPHPLFKALLEICN
jgi:CTP synthase (UTP-ammonia lyase)